MGDGSKIQWLQVPGTKPASWNPIRATNRETSARGWYCEHVHRGCDRCYAESQNQSASRGGTGLPFKPGYSASVEVYLDEVTLLQPIKWRTPRTIFVCSMTDLYGHWVLDEWLNKIFAVAAATPQHTYIVLTKRAMRMRKFIGHQRNLPVMVNEANRAIAASGVSVPAARVHDRIARWPLPNVWLLVSCSEQKNLSEFVPALLSTPAAVRGLSLEPMLEELDLAAVAIDGGDFDGDILNVLCGEIHSPKTGCVVHELEETIDWVIVGGESGWPRSAARPFNPAWAATAIRQCKAHRVPIFVKQMGSKAVGLRTNDHKGGDWDEWDPALRVREWPATVDRSAADRASAA